MKNRSLKHPSSRNRNPRSSPKMHISTYSLAETFDIGRDTGTQVDDAYEGSPYPFTGTLDRVTVTLTDT